MESFISVVLGELTTRSINFLIGKISKPTPVDVEDRLRRILLRSQVIVDEAMGRRITNQAMLLQLGVLRDAMHRGYYRLDTIRCQSHIEAGAKDQAVSRSSSSLSKISYTNRLSSRGSQAFKELQESLDDLSSMILDVKELVLFLPSYPRMYRQPYSKHIQLANCMFGRQMEAQLVINFLLHAQPHGAEELEVLPIVGPRYAGKSTLVAHACKDERVRDHFSEISFFHIQSLTDDELATFRDECELKHQNRVSKSNLEGRLLVVIELNGDLNEDAWSKLYSAAKQYASRGSKIIVTSRFDSIVKFGTTRPLALKYLSHEEFWYFFKTLAFGSMDPEMHPRLMHLAMEIFKTLRRCHIGANIIAHLLSDNFNVRSWYKIAACLRRSHQKLAFQFGDHLLVDLPNQNVPVLFGTVVSCENIMLYRQYHERPSEEDVPKIKFQDVLCGRVKPHGKFGVLAWRSGIPPYYSYIYNCEFQGLQTRAVKRKRSMRNGVTSF